MNKSTIVILTLMFTLGITFTVFAANIVEWTATSEAITKVDCEKAGSMSFAFDAGSTIAEGDSWFVDLDFGTCLCRPIDFEITTGGFRAGFITTFVPNGTTTTIGHVDIVDIGNDGASGGITVAGGMVFRVQGVLWCKRVTITAIGTTSGNDSLMVLTDTKFIISLFDSTTPGSGTPNAFSFKDSDGDGAYGELLPADYLDPVDNSFCINAVAMSENCVDVSVICDSRNDKFTFTRNSQVVAHVVASDWITLVGCRIGAVGEIDLSKSMQGVPCRFDYEIANERYCPGTSKNRVIIQNNSRFFEPADYQIKFTIIAPIDGVYWGGTPGFEDTKKADILLTNLTDCTSLGTNIDGETPWTLYLSDGVTQVQNPDMGTCSVTSAKKAIILESNKAGFGDVNDANQIWINIPRFVFDSPLVSPGDTVTIQVELIKLPCSVIYKGTLDIGTFVNNCGGGAYHG